MTAPRLPFEKSYSLRMVLLRFAFTGFARRNQPGTAAARCVDDDDVFSPNDCAGSNLHCQVT